MRTLLLSCLLLAAISVSNHSYGQARKNERRSSAVTTVKSNRLGSHKQVMQFAKYNKLKEIDQPSWFKPSFLPNGPATVQFFNPDKQGVAYYAITGWLRK